MSEPVRNDDSGIGVTLSLRFIQTCIFVYDFFTYPLYYAIQQPWKKVEAMGAIRAHPIEETKTSMTFKPIEKSCEDLEKFKAAGIQTMYDCFEYAVKLHSHSRMVGTRKVIREEDEVQPNGKVFKKWEMGDYEWKSYTQVRYFILLTAGVSLWFCMLLCCFCNHLLFQELVKVFQRILVVLHIIF